MFFSNSQLKLKKTNLLLLFVLFYCSIPFKAPTQAQEQAQEQTSQTAANFEPQTTSKTNNTLAQSEHQQKHHHNKNQPHLNFISKDKLIFSSPEVDIFQSEAQIQESFLDNYFNLYKLEFINKSSTKINFTGNVLNRVSSKEATAKLMQHIYIAKKQKRRIKMVTYTGLVSFSIVAGLYSPSLALYKVLQKAIASAVTSATVNAKQKVKKHNSFKIIEDFVNSEKSTETFSVNPGETHELWYLLPVHPQTDPVTFFKSSSDDNSREQFYLYSKQFDDQELRAIAKSDEQALRQTAFVDGDLLEGHKAGFYIQNNKTISQINLTNLPAVNRDRSKHLNLKIASADEPSVFKPYADKIFLHQNIFKHPSRYQIELFKLKTSTDVHFKESQGELVNFALKEFKPGLLEMLSPNASRLRLAKGDYAILINSEEFQNQVFIFKVL
jgi:hypothetical protein